MYIRWLLSPVRMLGNCFETMTKKLMGIIIMSIEYNPNVVLGLDSNESSLTIGFCRAFQQGDCKRGSSCKFQHQSVEKKREFFLGRRPCFAFQKGECKHSPCRFDHDSGSSSKETTRRSSHEPKPQIKKPKHLKRKLEAALRGNDTEMLEKVEEEKEVYSWFW